MNTRIVTILMTSVLLAGTTAAFADEHPMAAEHQVQKHARHHHHAKHAHHHARHHADHDTHKGINK